MARGEWTYGKSVVDGRVRFLSPSSIEKGDASSNNGGGCERKWAYRYVFGFKDEKDRPYADLGVQCHGEIENYLLTGENTLGRIAAAAKRYIPLPDPKRERLLVEYDIGRGSVEAATLKIEGVAIVGYTDVIHVEPAINLEGDGLFDDPPGTGEALDWKFGSAKLGAVADERGRGACFAKKGFELATDTQMILQGEWLARTARVTPSEVRLSHVYTNTKGRPEASKASILMPRERIAKRMEYITGVVRSLVHVAAEADIEKVPANTNACDAYGGCAYAESCSARSFNSLETFFGNTGAEALIETLQLGDVKMGLMESLNLPAQAPAVVPVVATPTAVAAVIPGYDIMAQIAAQSGAAVAPAWPQGFAEAVAEIEGKGYGFPPLGGAAAAAYGALKRSLGNPSYLAGAAGYAGSGDLAGVAMVTDPNVVAGIAADMRPLPVKPANVAPPPAAPLAMGLVSPETPASKPELAALPVEGFPSPGVTPGVLVPGLMASVPAAVAAPIVAAAAAPQTAAGALPEATPAKTRKPRGPNKPKATAPAPIGEGTFMGPGDEAPAPDGSWLFVNCRPNIAHEDIQTHLDTWSTGMAKHYQCNPLDIRMAAKDSVLAYGAWKGGYAALAAAAAKTLPAGAWFLNTRGSELNEAALEGLRQAKNTDGTPVFEMIVRGDT